MLIDSHKRKIDYLRISVTDRCNLRCIYCLPEGGIAQKPPSEILTFEEICQAAGIALGLGITKIRVTGGEPLLRKNLPVLLQMLSALEGLKDLSLTTNGLLLKKHINDLKAVGLKRLNISLDTLNDKRFEHITRFGRLIDVLEGIDAAQEAGFFVKLNVVAMRGLNDDEILDFISFGNRRGIIVRFIELMPMLNNNGLNRDLYIPWWEIKERLEVLGKLKPHPSRIIGNGPAFYYSIEGTRDTVGFISPLSCKFCSGCNRLRLTADGRLMPCLVSNETIDLKEALRKNREEVHALIKKAVFLKPQGHNISNAGQGESIIMSQIGG